MRATIATLCLFLTTSCASSYLDRALVEIEEERYEAALVYLEKGAAEGDEHCAYALATLLMSGVAGVEPNATRASSLIREAAIKGHSEAQFEIGIQYDGGEGVEQDQAVAIDWYRKAADAGLPEAQAQMGFVYFHGEGVEKNPEVAADWFERAAKQGNSLAQTALGSALFEGAGVERDLVDAYMWTRLAANQGNKKAKSNLPIIIEEMSRGELWKARKKVTEFRPTGAGRERIRVKSEGYGYGGRRMNDARRGGLPGR